MCDWESESHEGKSHNNCVINPIKHGMKADGFERRGQSWYVATDFPNDLLVEIEDVNFHLHKFSLLSRCGRLNRVLHDFRTDTNKDHIRLDDIPGGAESFEFRTNTNKDHIRLDDIPGGAESFELAAKFCYGVAVDLNSSNISGLRCTAEYLEMTEDLEEGNLIFKTEAFLSYVVLSSWRDSIIVLKSCEQLSPWAENLQIVRRCSESIAWKACANTRQGALRWSYTVSKSAKKLNQSPNWNESKTYSPGHQQVPPDWWFEDVSILRIDHFVKVITAIKVKGMRFELIGASILHYASKWLPGISRDSARTEDNKNDSWKGGGLHIVVAEGRDDLPGAQISSEQRLIVESLISILPPQKDAVSCSFLLRLLRMANMVKVAPALVTELEKRVGMQLEQATLDDLLIPSYTTKGADTLYEVDLVQRLLEHFLIQQQTQEPASPRRGASAGEKMHAATAGNAKMQVARLVDSYLTEIALDRNLSMTKFQVLAEALPDSARTCDDGLYRAIDSYLKAHPTLSEHERKRLCKVMNCQKLSSDACIHSAHNERLPLRIVVQVLFSEQAKIANAIASNGVLPIQKEQTDHQYRMDFYSQQTNRFSRVLENLPESFQEGWSLTKKDVKTIMFDMENLKSKLLQLQSEVDTLNHQFCKFSKPKSSVSAWSTGWKKLSKLKHSSIFHTQTQTQDMGSLHAHAPEQVARKTRHWRNSIS